MLNGDALMEIFTTVHEGGPKSTEDLATMVGEEPVEVFGSLMSCGRSMRLKVRDGVWRKDPGPPTYLPPDM
jgi:hypothetical protein